MLENNVEVIFDAKSENESFARVVAAAFVTKLDPTLEEISDIKTAVSEAVTNCIVHGYEGEEGKVYMDLSLKDNEVTIKIKDDGVGIDNIDVKYANEKGIIVKNTPNASSDSVAELAIAHMFAVARFLGASNYTMRIGEWNKKKYEGIELSGKILGIIGMGRIGRALATKATALGMKVVYNDILEMQK